MPLVEEIGDVGLREVHVEWKIPRFLMLSQDVDDYYYSPVFSFADEEFYLGMYPNRETEESPKRMNIFLVKKESVCEEVLKTVYFTLGIEGPNGVELMEEVEFNFETEGYGISCFRSKSELRERNSLVPSSDLTITCDLRSNPYLNDVTGEEILGKSLLSMLENGEDTDVIIKVQGKEFPAHRNILRARSPVFKSMFSHDMVEKQSGVVTIKDCDADMFHDFLVHIYTGSYKSISIKNVSSLYMAADKYDISELKEECVKFMIKNLSITIFCNVVKLAVKYDEKKLIERATIFFCDNSLKIVRTAKWQNFLKRNAILGNELFIRKLSK